MKKKYILFDLDGTLTDPALGITNSIMYALDKMNVPCQKEKISMFLLDHLFMLLLWIFFTLIPCKRTKPWLIIENILKLKGY